MLVQTPPLYDIMIELAQHTGLFALLVLAFSQIIHASHLYRSRWRSVLMGTTFGIFSDACMMMLVTVGGGLIIDGRNVLMALSGLIFSLARRTGAVTAALSTAAAVLAMTAAPAYAGHGFFPRQVGGVSVDATGVVGKIAPADVKTMRELMA